jgi:hypothetical protein
MAVLVAVAVVMAGRKGMGGEKVGSREPWFAMLAAVICRCSN